jgi:hypothetical protein
MSQHKKQILIYDWQSILFILEVHFLLSTQTGSFLQAKANVSITARFLKQYSQQLMLLEIKWYT